ncbi:MAG TPA: hypothetical protein VGG46_11010 [Terriglobales bacterium]
MIFTRMIRASVCKWILFLFVAVALAAAADQDQNKKPEPPQHHAAAEHNNNQHGGSANSRHDSNQPARHSGTQNNTHNNNQPAMHGGAQNGMHNNNRPAMHNGPQNSMHNNNQPAMRGSPSRENSRMGPGHPQNRGSQMREVHLRDGGSARFAHNGNVREFHSNGMDVQRGIRGDRVVVHTYAGGRRVVSMGPRLGFSERPYVNHGGHVYIQRTYVYGGHSYAYAYRTITWGGRPYYRYAPAFYYHPAYYGWAYRPWAAPVYFSWGWGGPWYGSYNYYLVPAPVYPSASFWLTDYLLAANLQLAYDAQQESAANAAPADYGDDDAAPTQGTVQLSPQVKQAISDEVKQQLAEEQQAASSSGTSTTSDNQVPAALDPNSRVFVVASNLDVTDANGQECELSGGDVISRIDDQADSNNKVRVSILSSKKGDCSASLQPSVDVGDLQEMNNQMRQQVDSGMKQLATDQGKDGLPKAPDTGTTAGEVAPPQPDADADSQLQQEQNEADQATTQVQQEAGQSNNDPGTN